MPSSTIATAWYGRTDPPATGAGAAFEEAGAHRTPPHAPEALPGAPPADRSPIDEFARTLAQQGLPQALAGLNGGVPHRYTALYRLEGTHLHSAGFHDKAGRPQPEAFRVIDMAQGACQHVLRVMRDGAFLTDNASFDSRLEDHPHRHFVIAFHGVRVSGPRGALLGTLCHFDTVPRGLMHPQFDLLQQAAQQLAPWARPAATR